MFNFLNKILKKDEKKKAVVYICYNCGNLKNYISVPCHCCAWAPSNIDEMSSSFILTNNLQFNMSELLDIGRQISKKNNPNKVISNLSSRAKELYEDDKETIDYVFDLCNEDKKNYLITVQSLKTCDCGVNNVASDIKTCRECSSIIDLTDTERLLICVSNILYLFVQRINYKDDINNRQFIEVLVEAAGSIHKIINQPNLPLNRDINLIKSKLSSMLKKVNVLCDQNNGGVVSWLDNKEPEIHIVKNKADEDTQMFSVFLYTEIVSLMNLTNYKH